MRAFGIVAAAVAVAGAGVGRASAAECRYRIDLPGHASVSSSSQRIDSSTVERTDTTRIGRGAQGAGTLIINTDGTYEIRGYLGLGASRKGRWIDNDEGPFSDKGGVELLDVKGENYAADQRAWFVYTNDEGELVGREPPYSGFNDLYFTNLSGAQCNPAKRVAAGAPAAAALAAQAGNADSGAAAGGREWTYDGFREHFMNMPRAQVLAELGAPQEKGYKSLTFHKLTVRDPGDASQVSHSATIGFTEEDGGEAWHFYFF